MIPELRELARKAVDLHSECKKGIDWMLEQVDQNAPLKRAIMLPAIEVAAKDAYYQTRHEDRRRLKQKPSTNQQDVELRTIPLTQRVPNKTKRGKTVMEAVHLMFLSKWKIGDKRLGDVTKAELKQERDNERLKRLGHSQNEKFYLALEQKMPNDTTMVKQVCTNKEAEALWRRVTKKIA
jgi:hypothetical protein